MSSPPDVLFRETAMCRFPDPEERETLQRFGALVLSWAVGAEHGAEGRDTPTGSEIAPVAADLRHLAGYLRVVVEEVEGAVVETRESHLAHLATSWARRADGLAREVEAAVEAAEARTESEDVARLRAALRDAQRLEVLFEELAEAGGEHAGVYRDQHRRASDLGSDLEMLLDEEPGEDPEGES